MKNVSHSTVMERLGSVMFVVLVLVLATVQSAAAAPLTAESSIVWPILEKIIVIAGAVVLAAGFQRWQERRNNKK